MSTIRFNLSKTAIKRAISMAKSDQAKLQEYSDEISKMMAQAATQKAREVAAEKLKYPTSEFLSNIGCAYVSPGVWKTYLGGPHGAYVEYGTGPIAAKDPHPDLDAGAYKKEGWVTQADGKDMQSMYGWEPMEAEDGSTVYYTVGQRPAAFMHEAEKYIQRQWFVNRVAAEARRRVFGK